MNRLKHRLCHLERQAASRGPPPSTIDQSAIERDALFAEYLAAAERAMARDAECLTAAEQAEQEQECMAVYERLLAEARRR